MACSSSARTWKLTTRWRDSTSPTTKILQNTSTFLFFSPVPSRQSKWHNFPVFSSDPLFSSSFCSSSCSKSRKKYVKYVRIHNGSLSDMQHDETRNNVEKLVVKKQPLWGRILFASKKMRSIMLLNLITIVYGEFPTSLGFIIVKSREKSTLKFINWCLLGCMAYIIDESYIL